MGNPSLFYSLKSTPDQINYTNKEIETLKEFRTTILVHRITVYTDHKNITFNNFRT